MWKVARISIEAEEKSQIEKGGRTLSKPGGHQHMSVKQLTLFQCASAVFEGF